ncbi:universally conserved protein [Hyperthermus butylicus DSM 5456]|uniref:Phosphomevalonate dehydratase large subunit n=2 Tax=Hyperthermus butylicus TaxID=54248 RepID=A2BN87_HYPBU|nr:universally conserved protein [Hyperthermus butylicus DSM 5456]
MLSGEYGEAVRKALTVIVRVGEALGAERLVEITHAHVSGISYFNIGDVGLEFIEELARMGGRVRVHATFNPTGIPLSEEGLWEDNAILVGAAEAEKQLRIIRALTRMGFKFTATCIPYKLRRPRPGEHLAWGESSAVAVANTLYGARTNREGGPVALAAALTGRIYYWGLHLDENRKPTMLIRVKNIVLDELAAGLLGHLVGRSYQDQLPYIDAELEGTRAVISMCGAAAASGNTAMCIVRNYSPEDRGAPEKVETVEVTARDLKAERELVETASLEEADVFFTGCPHHDWSIVHTVLTLLESSGVRRLRKPMWIALPGKLPNWGKNACSQATRQECASATRYMYCCVKA